MINELYTGAHFDGSAWSVSFSETKGLSVMNTEKYPPNPEGLMALALCIKEKYLTTGFHTNRVILVTNHTSTLETSQLYLVLLKECLKIVPIMEERLDLHADRMGIQGENLAMLASKAAATGFDCDTLLLELTNVCTLNCLYCTQDIVTRPKGRMPLETAKKIINEYARCSIGGLGFHVMGEPTIHPDLAEIVGYATRFHIRTALVTNATLVDSQKAKDLFTNGLSQMVLSLQSFTDGQHNMFKRPHGKYTFEKLMSNIKEIILAKWENGTSTSIEIHIMDNSLYMPRGVKIVTNDKEAKDVLRFWMGVIKDLAHEAGCDDILKHNEKEERLELAKLSWPIGNYTLAPGINLTFKMAGHWQQDFLEEGEAIIPVKTGRCQAIENDRQLSILWNGDAILCCFDYNGRTRFANLNDTTLHDVFRKAEKLRNELIQWGNITLPVCRRCLGIRIKLLGNTPSFMPSKGEVPLSRVAVFGKNTSSVNIMHTLQGGGIKVLCFLEEKEMLEESETMAEQRPVYHFTKLPHNGVEAILFPPEWKKDENIIMEMKKRYSHILLGQVDMVALNPFDRQSITRYRKKQTEH